MKRIVFNCYPCGYNTTFFSGIVFFRRREAEVYPDDYPNKPEVGEELNKPSEITIFKVWPNDKSTHTPVKVFYNPHNSLIPVDTCLLFS